MFIVKKNPKSLSAEAYRLLRTNLEYSSIDKSLKSIVVTSTEPGEGKSTVAGNLAIILGESGKKVILIDADLRKPSLHKKFKVSNGLGLTDYLIGKCKLTDVLKNIDDNVLIIPAGNKAPNPAEIIASKSMEELIETLSEKIEIDYIIIDTPPVKHVADAVALAGKCDGTIVIVKSGLTKVKDLTNVLGELEKVRANIIGTVLNGVERNKKDYYNYYYGDD